MDINIYQLFCLSSYFFKFFSKFLFFHAGNSPAMLPVLGRRLTEIPFELAGKMKAILDSNRLTNLFNGQNPVRQHPGGIVIPEAPEITPRGSLIGVVSFPFSIR